MTGGTDVVVAGVQVPNCACVNLISNILYLRFTTVFVVVSAIFLQIWVHKSENDCPILVAYFR